MDDVTIFSQLNSSWHGGLHHVLGVVAPALDVSVSAGRIFADFAKPAPCVLDARGLDLPSGAHTALQDWPIQNESVFGFVERKKLTDHVFRPREIVDELTFARHRLYHPIEPFTKVVDVLGATFPVLPNVWCMVVFLRCSKQRAFTDIDFQALERFKPAMANVLRISARQEFARSNAVSSTEMADGSLGQALVDPAGLLAKLTRTERRVLELLRSHATERAVADQMHRSPHTVHVHVKNIYRKMNVKSRKHLLQLFGDVREI